MRKSSSFFLKKGGLILIIVGCCLAGIMAMTALTKQTENLENIPRVLIRNRPLVWAMKKYPVKTAKILDDTETNINTKMKDRKKRVELTAMLKRKIGAKTNEAIFKKLPDFYLA